MGYEYLRNEAIIRSKTREFFGVGTVVTASAYLVSVVDFMLIGALLGADAVAAAGLCDSFVDVAELFGFVLSSGGPVAAGILLGKRRLRQANGVFTLSLLLTLAGGLLCWCLLPFCGFFSGVLSNNGAIANDVARYAFFTLLSSPFVGVNLVLSSFAILDDRSKLAMGSVVAANGVNIVLDVVFMKYLRTARPRLPCSATRRAFWWCFPTCCPKSEPSALSCAPTTCARPGGSWPRPAPPLPQTRPHASSPA